METVNVRKDQKSTEKRQALIAAAVLLLCGCGYGLFYEWTCALVSIALVVFWIAEVRKKGYIAVPKAPLLLGMGSLPVFAILTIPFAIDRGMAAMGMVKFSPLLWWILALAMDEKGRWKRSILQGLPYVSGILTILGMAAWLTPARDYFFIQNRFSGTFQYANSYALFLLVSLVIVLHDAKRYGTYRVAALAAVFVSGILATGCRTVTALTVCSVLAWGIDRLRTENRKEKLGKGKRRSAKNATGRQVRKSGRKMARIAAGSIGILGACLLVIEWTDGFGQIARYTQISVTSSSLMTRILYIKDGVGMLMHHSFGLGYRGFQFYQGAVQTGNYQATYAHNELLQSGLDFGIPVMLFLGAAYLRALYMERKNRRNFMVLLVCGIHGLLDWNFQFLLLPMLLVLFVGSEGKWKIDLKRPTALACTATVGAAVCISCAWLGTASFLEFVQDYEKAAWVYPGLTTSQMQRINQTQEEGIRYQAAEQIASQNDYCTIALQALAEKAAGQGDFGEMARYGKRAVASARYNSQGYEIYLYLLSYAVQVCSEQGQNQQAYEYLREAATVAEMIDEVEASTSRYAVYLYEKPEIQLGDQYETYMKEATAAMKREEKLS